MVAQATESEPGLVSRKIGGASPAGLIIEEVWDTSVPDCPYASVLQRMVVDGVVRKSSADRSSFWDRGGVGLIIGLIGGVMILLGFWIIS